MPLLQGLWKPSIKLLFLDDRSNLVITGNISSTYYILVNRYYSADEEDHDDDHHDINTRNTYINTMAMLFTMITLYILKNFKCK